jgi:hypothetical protein
MGGEYAVYSDLNGCFLLEPQLLSDRFFKHLRVARGCGLRRVHNQVVGKGERAMSRIGCTALVLTCCLSMGRVALAQSGALVELYGEGVHRYFAGDYFGAQEILTRAIDGGLQDPRAFYFRGLASEVVGGGGAIDFETGARLEVEGKISSDVGAALTRIQGALRAQIETARRDARVFASAQQAPAPMAPSRAMEPITPMEQAPMELAPDTAPLPPTPPLPSETDSDDPFSSDNGLQAGETTVDQEQPSAPEIDSKTDPFGDDTIPAPDAAPAQPAVDPFGGTPAPTEATDPFGAAPADGADPFGAPSGDAPAGGDPFGAPPAGDGGNPFDL